MTPDPQCRSCACTPTLPCPGGCAVVSEEPRLCSHCAGTTGPQVFAKIVQFGLPAHAVMLLIAYARAGLRQPEAEGLLGTEPVRAIVAQIEALLVAGGVYSEAGLTLLHSLEAAGRPRILLSRETNGRMHSHSMGAASSAQNRS